MKRIITLVLVASVMLCSCTVSAHYEKNEQRREQYTVSSISKYEKEVEFMNAVWISQFDLHPMLRDGGKMRDKADFYNKITTVFDNLTKDGFDTVFIQLRPNGDSMYPSEVYPSSKYVTGIAGGNFDYDPIGIIMEIAEAHSVSMHAWINPFRLCSTDDAAVITDAFPYYSWYKSGNGKVVECGGMLYLNPAYTEVTELICRGAEEICERYSFDGLHIDDYFYPTEEEFNDEKEFLASGYTDKGDFRRDNISRTVKALYDTAHSCGMVFGVSPAGNLYSLADGWYADAELWCSTEGYVDYIMPQLYFGFLNNYCPFERVLADWADIVTCQSVVLYIGLSAAKAVIGSKGGEDVYAGNDEARAEWINSKDILARSIAAVLANERAEGVCFFCYSSLYDPVTGEENPYISEEKQAFLPYMG